MTNKSSSELVTSNSKLDKKWISPIILSLTATLTTTIAFIRIAPTFHINIGPKISSPEISKPAIQAQQDDCSDELHEIMRIANNYNQMGKPEKGYACYTKAESLPHSQDAHADILNGQAWSRNLQHRPQDALKLTEAALALNPRFSYAWLNQANAQWLLGKQKEACFSAIRASRDPRVQLDPAMKSSCRI